MNVNPLRPGLLAALLLALAVAMGAAPVNSRAASRSVELRVLGYRQWTAGGPAGIRVIAYDARTCQGVADVPVTISLKRPGTRIAIPLVQGRTNAQGTLDARFLVPAQWSGEATLQVKPDGAASEVLAAEVHLRQDRRAFLTTDKPLYQPGQTVHVRVLALREPMLKPMAGAPWVVEVEDAKGNKVFKQRGRTSRFGVASAAFPLATEVNMGEYHVRCFVGSQGEVTADKSITVKRYVLPRFKLAVKTERAWYEAGDTVRGTLQADYFFGKPVAGAHVSLDVRTFDVDVRDVARVEGTTDASGAYAFELKLPDYFTGQPLDKGQATLQMAVHVRDASDHEEETGTQVAVVSSPIRAEVFPEGGRLIPGLPNQLYVLTTHPDGTPAPGTVRVTLPGFSHEAATDDTGFATVTYAPARPPQREAQAGAADVGFDGPTVPLRGSVTVKDRSGHEATVPLALNLEQARETILIRPDRALYRVGDVFHARILSSKGSGSAYVDFIRNDQTILTRSVEIRHGCGDLSVPLSPDTYGAIQVHAYEILSTSDTVRDTRKIFVQPARDLIVEVKPDAASYRPGQDATLRFLVKDAEGSPTLAVLGVDVVDESLFALAERQPGLERVYFLLEKALTAARYEVHGLSLPDVVGDAKPDTKTQRLSRMLLGQTPAPRGYDLRLDTFDRKLAALNERLMRVQNALYSYRTRHGEYPETGDLDALVDDGLIGSAELQDPWGRRLRVRVQAGYPVVFSVGPDGVAGTADDVRSDTCYGAHTKSIGLARRGMIVDAAMPAGAMNAAAFPAPARLALDEREAGAAGASYETDHALAGSPEPSAKKPLADAPRIRQFFPETLFTAPEVVTDAHGEATVHVPLADSITTWRLSAFASSLSGLMGSATGALRVFQDFFVDLDVPVALTQGDEVTMPVSIYNYLHQGQTVRLQLQKSDWYELVGDDEVEVKLGPNQVAGAAFRIRAKRPGSFALTLTARGSEMSDAVRRSIRVVPDGREFTRVRSDRLRGTVNADVEIPKDAVADASQLLVTVYPGIFSQVVEGLDGILRMPGGCFEQTSSSTYPDVLVAAYLKKVRKATPALQMKAEGFINAGYQRLLTFEVAGGGFSVFGEAPANPILTAYGLMEFADMAKVHEVDPDLVPRTTRWLLAQQQKDGSWSAGRQGFYAEGWSNVPNSDLVATAYITWALLESGAKGERVARAAAYVRRHLDQVKEPYTAALAANALVAARDPGAAEALKTLLAMRVEEKDMAYWRTRIATAAFGTGKAGDIETTALATLALLGSGEHADVANQAIAYLVKSKDAFGTWDSTQATVLAMKALVATVDRAAEHVDARVRVSVNGHAAGSFRLNADNFDVCQQVDASPFAHPGANHVVLQVDGQGNALYKIATRFWRHWAAAPPPPSGILGIAVSYDRDTLAKDDTATCTVRVTNKIRRAANMVMVDVGVPPGFDVQTADLEALVKKDVIQKFSVTGRQVIIYLTRLDAGRTLALAYGLKARFPVRAQAPASEVYEYYNPARSATAPPREMVIR